MAWQQSEGWDPNNWWTGTNSLAYWLLGPGSVAGSLNASPYGSWQNDASTVTPQEKAEAGYTVNSDQAGRLIDRAQRAYEAGELTWDEWESWHNRIIDSMSTYTNPYDLENSLEGAIGARIERTRADELYAKQQAAQSEALSGLETVRSTYEPVLNRNIERYQKATSSAAALRGDADYGKMLAEAESSVASNINQTRQSASRGLASRGLAGSGKMSDAVRQSELQGAAARGSMFQTAYSDAMSRLENAQTSKAQFESDMTQNKYNIQSGSIGNLQNLSSYWANIASPSYAGPQMTGTDLSSLQKGQERADFGMGTNFLLGLGSLLVNAAGTGMESTNNLIGMFRNG